MEEEDRAEGEEEERREMARRGGEKREKERRERREIVERNANNRTHVTDNRSYDNEVNIIKGSLVPMAI